MEAEPKPLQARVDELEREVAALRAEHRQAKDYWAQLEEIIERAPLAVYLKDVTFKYLLVNREYEKLSGQQRSNIIGRTDFDVLAQPVAQLFRDQDRQVIARDGPVEFRETIALPDGVHSFITSKFPLRTEGGGISGVAGVCTEVTALERVQQSLDQAQAEILKRERLSTLGELSAVIAHEVRNPLGVIFNALSALKRIEPPEARRDDLLGIIGEEADRLNRMVGALLDLARPPVAKLMPSAVEPLIWGAIEAARALTDPEAEVQVHSPGPVPPARVDEQMLRQALVNLVSNAIQAPQRRSPVSVRVLVEGAPADMLRFEVADDGAGVPPELVERIFTPFFTTRAKGTGLGLAVVRRVAEAHGGAVNVQKTSGGGATFVLRVPLAHDAALAGPT
ncbi:MAG: sensor histidine kinase [Myxococcaceae bacterium]